MKRILNNINTYILVKFPESQKYISCKQCHVCIDIEGAYFVPKHIYNKKK